MVERDDNVSAMEVQLKQLNAEGRRAVDDRASQVSLIASLRTQIDQLRGELRNAEIAAHDRQQPATSYATDFDRSDIERQLSEMIELEHMARKRRSQAEQELKSEREALQKLEDRLKKLEQDAPSSTTPH